MIQNYKITIAYDGSRYHGFEAKPDVDTIQGRIENVLSRMTDTRVMTVGAGRTDAGVHARAMVISCKLDTEMSEEDIMDYMNTYLPEDIGVIDVKVAGERFHARFSAVGKVYLYTCYVGKEKPVFDRKYVWCLDKVPDVKLMRRAAEYLVGEHDFKSFCGNKNFKKSTVKKIFDIEIMRKNDYLYLRFHGKGFLQNMVRILTGTLLEVGYGNISPDAMEDILHAGARTAAGPTAPAKGLCLMKVEY